MLRAIGWIIGPTIWISSVVLMIHGLCTGAWHGYVFGAILITAFGSFLYVAHSGRRIGEIELERLLAKWQAEDNSDP